mgnify:FL=1
MLRKAFSEGKKKAARDGTGKGNINESFSAFGKRGFAEERVEKSFELDYIFADSKIKSVYLGSHALIPFVGDLHAQTRPNKPNLKFKYAIWFPAAPFAPDFPQAKLTYI